MKKPLLAFTAFCLFSCSVFAEVNLTAPARKEADSVRAKEDKQADKNKEKEEKNAGKKKGKAGKTAAMDSWRK